MENLKTKVETKTSEEATGFWHRKYINSQFAEIVVPISQLEVIARDIKTSYEDFMALIWKKKIDGEINTTQSFEFMRIKIANMFIGEKTNTDQDVVT